jgi:hypothetical protein
MRTPLLCSGKESEKWINGLIRGQVQLGRTEDHLGTHLSDAHPLMDRLFGWEQAMESMSVLLHRERERLINESSKQGSALAAAQAAKPPTPPDHFGSGLVFLTQILSLLAPGKKDGESVLDALIANDSVESAHKTALLATKAELERAKAALDEAQEQAKQAEQARLAEQSRLAEQAKLAEQARAAAEARFAALETALAALQSEKTPSIKKKPSVHRKHKLTRTSR